MKRYRTPRLHPVLLRSEQLHLTHLSSLSFYLSSITLLPLQTGLLVGSWLVIFVPPCTLARSGLGHQRSFLSSFVTQLNSECLWKFSLTCWRAFLLWVSSGSGPVLGIGDTKSSNIVSDSSNLHNLAVGQAPVDIIKCAPQPWALPSSGNSQMTSDITDTSWLSRWHMSLLSRKVITILITISSNLTTIII